MEKEVLSVGIMSHLKNPRLIGFLFFIGGLIMLNSCSKELDDPPFDPYLTEPACTSSFVPKAYTYHVVGFYPSWRHNDLPIDSIKWDRITRIVYAFAYPNADGSVDFSDLTQARNLIRKGHENGVEVFFSVGGAYHTDIFPNIARDPEKAERFVKSLRHHVFELCFDGVDVDWEWFTGFPSGIVYQYESKSYVNILKWLQEDLAPFNKKISVDLYPSNWGGRHYFDELKYYVDDIMIMGYNFSGSWSDPGPHSSYEDAIGSGSDVSSTGLAYWANYRKFPKSKILLGVPFYGKDFDNNAAGITYRSIVEMFPDAPNHDQVANIYYDGIETIKAKTQYVIENYFAGIMIWEIGQDTYADSTSLLKAIDEEISGR